MDDYNEIISKLKAAFLNVKKPEFKLIHARAWDDHINTENRKEFEEFCKGRPYEGYASWREIPDSTIEYYHDTLPFIRLQDYPFYIAAFLLYTINNLNCKKDYYYEYALDTLDPSRADPAINKRPRGMGVEQYEFLTDDQKSGICEVVKYIILNCHCRATADQMIDAYKYYWKNYDSIPDDRFTNFMANRTYYPLS